MGGWASWQQGALARKRAWHVRAGGCRPTALAALEGAARTLTAAPSLRHELVPPLAFIVRASLYQSSS